MSESAERDELRAIRGEVTRLFHEAQGLVNRLERLEGALAVAGESAEKGHSAHAVNPALLAGTQASALAELAAAARLSAAESIVATSELQEIRPEDLAPAATGASPFEIAEPARINKLWPETPSSSVAGKSSAPPALPQEPPAPQPSWESVVGGRWMTWIGASVLVVAVAFLVHWAWTHFQTPPELKAAAFHLLGCGILGGAYLAARQKLPVLARGLAGLGLFSLYAAAFAMLHWWDFMRGRELIVFAECLAITVLAIVLAVRANAFEIVLLGALGGYLTPLLTSTGSGNYVGLFSYLWFLNLALCGCAVWRGWNFLKPITVAATALMFVTWISSSAFRANPDGLRWGTELFVCLHAGLMLAANTIPPWLWRRKSTPADLMALSSNALWFMGMTWGLFHSLPTRQLAPVSWGLALLHLALFGVTYARLSNADRMPRVQLALAAVFFTLAAPLQLEDASLYWGLTWCIEGLIFAAVGLYFRDRQLRWTALAVFTIAAIRTLCFDYHGPAQLVTTLAIDQRFLIIGLTAAVAMAAGSLYWAIPHALGEAIGVTSAEDDRSIRYEGAGLVAAGNLLLLIAMTCQWHDRTVLFLWTLDAAIVWLAGFYFQKEALRWYGCILGIGLVGCRILYHHVNIDPAALPIANARCLSLVCVAVLYFVVSGLYRRQNLRLLAHNGPAMAGKSTNADERPLADILGVLANVLLLIAVSLEIDHRFDLWRNAGQTPFANMRVAELAAYSIVWTLYAATLVTVGFALRNRLFRLIGLVAFGPILLKVFFLDLAHLELLPRVLALAVVGMALLGVSFLYQKFATRVGAA